MRESMALSTAIANSVIRRDENGNPGLSKAKSRGRIDLLSAAVIGCGLAEPFFDKETPSDLALCRHGRMSKNHHALNKKRWALVRQIVFRRDGYRCMKCGKRGRLEAHHSPPLTAGADPYDVTGIFTYCRTCHISEHRIVDDTPGRSAWLEFLAELTAKKRPLTG